MKKLFFFFLIFSTSIMAQDLLPIKLNAPNMSADGSVMQALLSRRSIREYDSKQLSLQDMSDLLWAAYGINSPDGRRTAPTATNAQEIDVYVATAEGAYHYDAKGNQLLPIYKGDLRNALAAGQDFVKAAPFCIIITGDIAKLRGDDTERKTKLACMDGGIVSQNVAVFCASRQLATVPRAMMDEKALKEALKLKDSQFPILNLPVGYKK